MGDKSPKNKDRAKKQAQVSKDKQKVAAAVVPPANVKTK
jgi:hypothetical protein